MTSYILAQHSNGRDIHPSYTPKEKDARCPFCQIANANEADRKAYTVYEDEHTIAFLDLMPIRPGHTLLIPKSHCPRLADLSSVEGAAMGSVMPKIITAINKATDNPDLNVVLNQGFAQAVSHAHFHLIPAPHPSMPHKFRTNSLSADHSPISPVVNQTVPISVTTNPMNKRERNRSPADWSAQELMAHPPDHKEMLRGETEARMGWLGKRDGDALSAKIRSFL
ncbi:Zinc-binding protein of the histidine triad (HIT) family [Phaffia rhodozyma]|uniref:Zinc-binding protein of the histidine triad (HIT) family n=1 Tax=Phaffia rhodozyma TaxID=264483 RepID=A0A0F7SS86_PHARH|nr:Zinc-binding protein of the histidine triad (HIT) family [Phaffia rhodozyma]